jgi:hypothetical protein
MKKRLFLLASILILIFTVAQNANAQWVETGLTDSANVQALTVVGANTSSPMLFAGSFVFPGRQPGGVYLSTDSGTTWSHVGLIGVAVNSFAEIGANTSSPMLFAGASEDPPFIYGGGVYLTTNNGSSWNESDAGISDPHVFSLAVLGASASSPLIFAGTYYGGVFFSTNKGKTWTAVNNGLTAMANGSPVVPGVWGLAVSGADGSPQTLFAETSFGIYRTTNNGVSWEQTSTGLPDTANTRINALTVSDSNASPPTLMAGTTNHGVFLSTNNGISWSASNGGSTNIGTASISGFAVSGTNVFTGGGDSVFLSTNNGALWTVVNPGASFLVGPLTLCGPYLCAASHSAGAPVRRRLLSQMINPSGVEPTPESIDSRLDAYPNPFSQSTTISFTTSESGVATVAIVNILGVTVARIFSGELDAGTHTFTWDARGLPAGMYECIVHMNGKVERTAMVVN